MSTRVKLLASLLAVTASGGAFAQAEPNPAQGQGQGQANVEASASLDQIQDWSKTSQKAAKAMMEKYGPPAETTAGMWIWYDNGPWKRTIVYDQSINHDFPVPHHDVLEQFINYNAPEDRYDELAKFDGSVIVERTKAEMSARCDSEAANFLALNLANDVATGQKTVEEARKFYADAIRAKLRGEPPKYAQSFVFDVPEEDLVETDVALIEMPLYHKAAGQDEQLTVSEWDTAIDNQFGEDAVDLAASNWDEDGDGIISQQEFEEASAQSELLGPPQG